jgi:hypothetical protein
LSNDPGRVTVKVIIDLFPGIYGVKELKGLNSRRKRYVDKKGNWYY